MARASTGWIGIDIGTSTLKLAQMVNQQGRLLLAEASIIQRRPAWNGETLADASPLASSGEISAAITMGSRFRGRRAASTAPMSVCEVRGITTQETHPRKEPVVSELESLALPSTRGVVFEYWHPRWWVAGLRLPSR